MNEDKLTPEGLAVKLSFERDFKASFCDVLPYVLIGAAVVRRNVENKQPSAEFEQHKELENFFENPIYGPETMRLIPKAHALFSIGHILNEGNRIGQAFDEILKDALDAEGNAKKPEKAVIESMERAVEFEHDIVDQLSKAEQQHKRK